MEIKQSFLNSLQGLFQDQAQALVESEGLTFMGVNMGMAISRILRPDTIICWVDEDGTVGNVEPGDRGQVVDDT